ncbi:hypothetical protein Lepto7375DRAFT_5519 [Leptolyngbya sp. PCC 7375]|nr:hypothetical protein Lepto7375DRAFT_5519 [Leptolyngbya sp. PCC 7375]
MKRPIQSPPVSRGASTAKAMLPGGVIASRLSRQCALWAEMCHIQDNQEACQLHQEQCQPRPNSPWGAHWQRRG